jgi:hypothetical protein
MVPKLEHQYPTDFLHSEKFGLTRRRACRKPNQNCASGLSCAESFRLFKNAQKVFAISV